MHWTFRWDILWISFYTLRPPDITESSWRRVHRQSNLIRRLCVGNIITLTRERTLYTSHLNHNENLILYLILQKRSYSRMQSIIIEPLNHEYCIINSVLHNLKRHVFSPTNGLSEQKLYLQQQLKIENETSTSWWWKYEICLQLLHMHEPDVLLSLLREIWM